MQFGVESNDLDLRLVSCNLYCDNNAGDIMYYVLKSFLTQSNRVKAKTFRKRERIRDYQQLIVCV